MSTDQPEGKTRMSGKVPLGFGRFRMTPQEQCRRQIVRDRQRMGDIPLEHPTGIFGQGDIAPIMQAVL